MRSKCCSVLVPKDQLQKETQHLPDSSDTWERSHFEPLAEVNIGEEELFKDAAKVPWIHSIEGNFRTKEYPQRCSSPSCGAINFCSYVVRAHRPPTHFPETRLL